MRPIPDNMAVNSGDVADNCRISVFPHILCNLPVKPLFLKLGGRINHRNRLKMFVPCFPALGQRGFYTREQFAVLGSVFVLVELFAAVRKCFVILASFLALANAVYICFYTLKFIWFREPARAD